MIVSIRSGVAVLVAFCFVACGSDDANRHLPYSNDKAPAETQVVDSSDARAPTASAPTASANEQAGSSAVSGFGSKVKFKGVQQQQPVEYSIKPMADGAKLVDAAGKELARYTVKEELRIKVKDAADRELGQIKGDASKIHIEQPGDVRVFALQRQDDGDYKLETAAGELLNKIKKRDYGWKIEDASGNELAKVKVKSGKTSLRDASDAEMLATKDAISPLAMACLGLDKIEQPLRVALAMRMQAEGK